MDEINEIRRLAGLKPLTEAPINSWTVDPDFHQNMDTARSTWNGYSRETEHYSPSDVEAITNPAIIKRIQERFLRVKEPFNLYFWANPDRDYDKFLEVGAVDLEWMKRNFGEETTHRLLNIPNWHNSINVIMTNNLSDEDKINLKSPWAVAHRIAHVLTQRQPQLWYIVEEFVHSVMTKIYGIKWDPETMHRAIHQDYRDIFGLDIAHLISTMKTARDHKIVNYYEWLREMYVQYLLTGKITLNSTLPEEFHADVHMKKGAEKYVKPMIDKFAVDVQTEIQKTLDEAIGKFYVM